MLIRRGSGSRTHLGTPGAHPLTHSHKRQQNMATPTVLTAPSPLAPPAAASPEEIWPPADYVPIGDDLIAPGRTPFTAAQLNHGFSAYIGTRERAHMGELARDRLLVNPYIQGNPNLIGLVRLLHSGPVDQRGCYHDPWDVAIERLGKTVDEASPYMEYILAQLDIGVGYARCDHGQATSDVVTGPEARQQDNTENPHRPFQWIIGLTDTQKETILQEARERIAERTERGRRRRASIREVKTRLAADLRQMKQDYEACYQDPVRIAAYLRERGVEVAEDDRLPSLTELKAMLSELDERERQATFAPLPVSEMPPLPRLPTNE